MTMSTTMIKDNIITLVRCLERFALTSSSQAAGSSDWGNLLVQAWKMEKLDIALFFDRRCCCLDHNDGQFFRAMEWLMFFLGHHCRQWFFNGFDREYGFYLHII